VAVADQKYLPLLELADKAVRTMKAPSDQPGASTLTGFHLQSGDRKDPEVIINGQKAEINEFCLNTARKQEFFIICEDTVPSGEADCVGWPPWMLLGCKTGIGSFPILLAGRVYGTYRAGAQTLSGLRPRSERTQVARPPWQ
jgi:hypothetical protein